MPVTVDTLPFMLSVRILVISMLCIWGWWLRRKRRDLTEVTHLGFPFFLGWLITETAFFVISAWLDSPTGRTPSISHQWLCTTVYLPVLDVMVEPGMVLAIVLPLLVLACWMWMLIKNRFLNVLSFGGLILILVTFAFPMISRVLGDVLAVCNHGNVFVSQFGMQLVSAAVAASVLPMLIRTARKYCRMLFTYKVYTMEQNTAAALEKIFDENVDLANSIVEILSCMKIVSFAFYERTSRDGFKLVVSKNWTARVAQAISVSSQVRGKLGKVHELIDFRQLPYSFGLFFESFELWRLHLASAGNLLLPICLGTSVRGLLFLSVDDTNTEPVASALMPTINSFGLSIVTPR